MLEDKPTLQFILDTIQTIGGEPHKLDQVQDETVDLEITGNTIYFVHVHYNIHENHHLIRIHALCH